jgi:sodium/potassium-transporting ATPase subunit alpha
LVNNNIDLRAVYVTCTDSFKTLNFTSQFTWPPWENVVKTVSTVSKNYVAYTTETIFYAQSGYFVTIVMVQWSNVFACKSRKVILILFR